MILAVDFPPVSHLIEWPVFLGGDAWGINKVVLVYALAAGLTIALFAFGNRGELVPSGRQNLAEMSLELVENQIVLPTMGVEGLRWTPYMVSLFFFILFSNIFEIIPLVQMPATARIALPMFLALLTYVLYHGSGVKEHGVFGYFKHALVPPGVPVALLPLMVLIEGISKFIVQPFSHTVRLFANLLAGHILLVTFAVLTAALWTTQPILIFLPLPLAGIIFVIAFEVLVSILQAYVFTLLAGVYINMAVSHEH